MHDSSGAVGIARDVRIAVMIVVQYLVKAPEEGIANESIRLRGTKENTSEDNGPAKLFKSKN